MRGIVPETQNSEKETGKRPNTLSQHPHRAAVVFIDWIIPPRHRETVRDQLLDKTSSSCAYIAWGILYLAFIIARQLGPAFKPRLSATEVLLLSAAFAQRPWGQSSTVAVASGMAGLTLCDAYFHLDRRTPFQRGWEMLSALLFVISVQIYETLVSPAAALPPPVLARGAAVALLTIPIVRFLFQMPPSEEPFGTSSPLTTYLMTGMWMAAALTVIVTYEHGMPKFFLFQELLFITFTIKCFAVAFRLQKNQLERTWGRNEGRILFVDKVLRKLEDQSYWIWKPPDAKPGDFPWHSFWEILGFMMLAFPMAVTFSAWAQGYLGPGQMDWLTWVTNALAAAGLTGLWPFIRMANDNLAEAINKKKAERRKLAL